MCTETKISNSNSASSGRALSTNCSQPAVLPDRDKFLQKSGADQFVESSKEICQKLRNQIFTAARAQGISDETLIKKNVDKLESVFQEYLQAFARVQDKSSFAQTLDKLYKFVAENSNDPSFKSSAITGEIAQTLNAGSFARAFQLINKMSDKRINGIIAIVSENKELTDSILRTMTSRGPSTGVALLLVGFLAESQASYVAATNGTNQKGTQKDEICSKLLGALLKDSTVAVANRNTMR